MLNTLKLIFYYRNITFLLVVIYLSLKLIKDSFVWVLMIFIYFSIKNNNFVNFNIFYSFIAACFVISLLIYMRYYLTEKLLNDTSNKYRKYVFFFIKFITNIFYNIILFILTLYFSQSLIITIFIFMFIYFTHLIYLYAINKPNWSIYLRVIKIMPSAKNYTIFFSTVFFIFFLDQINLFEISLNNILIIIFIRFLSISIIDFYNYQLGLKNYHFFIKK